MKKISIYPVFVLFFAFISQACAQTDTGGGMGGTGVSTKTTPIAPVMSEELCSKDKSVGIYQLKSMSDGKTKKQGYVCEGQTLKTLAGERIELHLRSGEKITVHENSKIEVQRSQ